MVHPVIGLLAGHVIQPGDWFGEPASLGRRPRLASVQARGRCQVLAVTRKAIEGIIASNPGFSLNFFDLMAGNAEAYMLHAVDLLIRNPKTRRADIGMSPEAPLTASKRAYFADLVQSVGRKGQY